jgi:hypothetical protein
MEEYAAFSPAGRTPANTGTDYINMLSLNKKYKMR